MGLFDKKTDVVIAFVGKYTQRVSSLQERAIANTYRARLQSLIHHHYPGVSRYRVWFFRNWTDGIYSTSTLRRVAEDGFNAYDSGEKKDLFDKIEKVNDLLASDGEGLPPMSLSVGVAFSDRQKPTGDIFEDADIALQRMKQVRHCGCAVY